MIYRHDELFKTWRKLFSMYISPPPPPAVNASVLQIQSKGNP